jgi:hypothetical protein
MGTATPTPTPIAVFHPSLDEEQVGELEALVSEGVEPLAVLEALVSEGVEPLAVLVAVEVDADAKALPAIPLMVPSGTKNSSPRAEFRQIDSPSEPHQC